MSLSASTPYKTMKDIRLGVIGFAPTENMLIKGTCKLLNMTNKKSVKTVDNIDVVDIHGSQDVDIYIVDANQSPVEESRQWVKARQAKAAIIFVGAEEYAIKTPGEYILDRKNFGGPLFKLIEKIADTLHSDPYVPPAKMCLVVDDSQLVRTQMEMLLQEHQLATEFAEDAETALRMIRGKCYDIIFLDVILPEMDGYKACKLIKADPATKKTPVVMLTSKRSPFNKMHGALVGCDRYLTKPIEPDKVHKVLQQYAILAKA